MTLKRKHVALATALVLQFGFQIVTLFSLWTDGHPYNWDKASQFAASGETIRYVRCTSQHYQGEFITPTQGVINCYDNDDFIRVQFEPDAPLVRSLSYDGREASAAIDARFMSWNRIRIDMGPSVAAAPFTVVLNQAFNAHWSSPQCAVRKEGDGFLSATCSTQPPNHIIELMFHDALSERATKVSLTAWKVWLSLFVVSIAIVVTKRAFFSGRQRSTVNGQRPT